eukprot:GHVU01143956.1.p2 GENE.GHVU01143956.1~~GHVU01143956.1.p2  ORF type:complete len:190 (-),score=4.68 GHVU01143956.1:149-718(-)
MRLVHSFSHIYICMLTYVRIPYSWRTQIRRPHLNIPKPAPASPSADTSQNSPPTKNYNRGKLPVPSLLSFAPRAAASPLQIDPSRITAFHRDDVMMYFGPTKHASERPPPADIHTTTASTSPQSSTIVQESKYEYKYINTYIDTYPRLPPLADHATSSKVNYSLLRVRTDGRAAECGCECGWVGPWVGR